MSWDPAAFFRALSAIVLIWGDREKSLLMRTPRSLSWSTGHNEVPCGSVALSSGGAHIRMRVHQTSSFFWICGTYTGICLSAVPYHFSQSDWSHYSDHLEVWSYHVRSWSSKRPVSHLRNNKWQKKRCIFCTIFLPFFVPFFAFSQFSSFELCIFSKSTSYLNSGAFPFSGQFLDLKGHRKAMRRVTQSCVWDAHNAIGNRAIKTMR